MFWNRLQRIERLAPVAARFRRQHERWLTRALAQPERYRRIPIRPAASGGFDGLRFDPIRRAHADDWWAIVFARMDDE